MIIHFSILFLDMAETTEFIDSSAEIVILSFHVGLFQFELARDVDLFFYPVYSTGYFAEGFESPRPAAFEITFFMICCNITIFTVLP